MFLLTFSGPARLFDDSYLEISKAVRERGLRLVAQAEISAPVGCVKFKITPQENREEIKITVEDLSAIVKMSIARRHLYSCRVTVESL